MDSRKEVWLCASALARAAGYEDGAQARALLHEGILDAWLAAAPLGLFQGAKRTIAALAARADNPAPSPDCVPMPINDLRELGAGIILAGAMMGNQLPALANLITWWEANQGLEGSYEGPRFSGPVDIPNLLRDGPGRSSDLGQNTLDLLTARGVTYRAERMAEDLLGC